MFRNSVFKKKKKETPYFEMVFLLIPKHSHYVIGPLHHILFRFLFFCFLKFNLICLSASCNGNGIFSSLHEY